MDPKSKKGFFLGYKETSNSYIVMDFENYKIHQVSTIVCFEDSPANTSLSNIYNKHNIHNNFFEYYFTKSNITQNAKLLNENNDSTSIDLNCINKNLKHMEHNNNNFYINGFYNNKLIHNKLDYCNLLKYNYNTSNNSRDILKSNLNHYSNEDQKFFIYNNNDNNNKDNLKLLNGFFLLRKTQTIKFTNTKQG